MNTKLRNHRVLFATLFLCWVTFSLHAAPGTVQFSQPVFTVSEAGPIAYTDGNGVKFLTPTMTVTRNGGSTGALSVDFCVWPDETADNALEYTNDAFGNTNGNYVVRDNTRRWVAAGRLTWADGDTASKTLPFSIAPFGQTQYTLRAASAVQGTVTYSARITNLIGGAILGATASAKLEVTDAEGPAAGVLNLTSRRFYGADGGSAVISVRRDGGTTGSVSVNYTTSSTLPAVGANQASIGVGVAGTHYTATSGTLTWAHGDSAEKTFTVPLPATGNTNGALNVAINLSAPTNSAALGTVPSAVLTIQNKASVVYNINDNTDRSTYRVSLPPGTEPIRGILFWWPGTAGDDRHFTTDPNFRKIADHWRFAIVSPKGNYSSSPNRLIFPQPRLGFFFDRLAQIAKTTGRPEIIHAPFALSGMSAGSYDTSASLGIWPERTIAAICQEGWSDVPLDIYGQNDPLFVFNSLSREIPALNLGGQNDSSQSPPSQGFPSMNNYRKNYGLSRSSVALCWGRGHTFSNTGATYNSFALYWLDQVMSSGRYLPAQTPTANTAPVLGSLPLANGWWGARNCTNTLNYELSGGSSRFLNIGPDATFTGIKDITNALVDSWLPTESAARAYRAFVSLPTITFAAPTQFTSGLTGVATTLTIAENGFGTGLTKVEFYDGSTKIGEDTTSPYTLSWTPSSAGARSITAVASDSSGPKYTAFTLFLATAPAGPTITTGQSAAGAQGVAFSYQLLANGGPTAFALDSGALPDGITLNTATGLLSGTPTSTGAFTPAFTATNAAGTSLAVTLTLTVRDPLLARWRFDNSLAAEPVTYDASAVGTINYAKGQIGSHALSLPGTDNNYVSAPSALNPALTDFTASAWVYLNNSVAYAGYSVIGQTDVGGTGRGWLFIYADPSNVCYVTSKIGGVDTTSSFIFPTAQWTHIAVVKSGTSVKLYFNGVADTATTRTTEASTGLLRIGASKTGTNVWNGRLDDVRLYDAALSSTAIASLYLYTEHTASALATFRTTTGLASDGSQDLLTPAGDGVPNLLKYAFNMLGSGVGQGATLTTPNAAILIANGFAGLPFVGMDGTGKLQLTFLRRKASATPSPGISYTVEFSNDLGLTDPWAPNGLAAESITSLDATFDRVTVTDSTTSPAKRFVRVKVTTP